MDRLRSPSHLAVPWTSVLQMKKKVSLTVSRGSSAVSRLPGGLASGPPGSSMICLKMKNSYSYTSQVVQETHVKQVCLRNSNTSCGTAKDTRKHVSILKYRRKPFYFIAQERTTHAVSRNWTVKIFTHALRVTAKRSMDDFSYLDIFFTSFGGPTGYMVTENPRTPEYPRVPVRNQESEKPSFIGSSVLHSRLVPNFRVLSSKTA